MKNIDKVIIDIILNEIASDSKLEDEMAMAIRRNDRNDEVAHVDFHDWIAKFPNLSREPSRS